MGPRDVVVLGAGLAGLAAAYELRDLDVEVLETAGHVGGRTRSTRLPNGPWLNYGAQYITEDRPGVVALADALGVELLRSENFEDYWRGMLPAGATERAEVAAAIERIEAAQADPRPATLPELDDQSFADWLGPMSAGAARYFDSVCELMNSASAVELSVYGGLWIWGDQRSSPWSTGDIPRHDRGEVIVAGGTGELARALERAIGGRVSLDSHVMGVLDQNGGCAVEIEDPAGPRRLRARRVVCALPAPSALEVLPDLPGWKRAALSAVRYGRWISTPIVVAPLGSSPTAYPLVASRADVRYNADGFMSRTPGDPDEVGACFHSFMSNSAARQVWDDPDDSVRSGAVRALLDRFPQYRDRIVRVDLQRWEHGIPQYVRGLMRHFPALAEPVGAVHFCGDYTWQANMEGAVRSGQRAAAQVRAAIS